MANAGLRFLANLAPTAKDKLEVVKRTYPDAKYNKSGDIVFTDPETKQETRLDPKGFDLGDLADLSDVAVETAGSIGGGLLGALAGGLPAFAGAAAGGPALKALLQKGLSSVGAVPDSRKEGETTTDLLTETGVNAALGGLLGTIGKGAKKLITPEAKDTLSRMTGLGYTPTLADVGSSTGRQISRYASDATQKAQQANLTSLQDKILQSSGSELTTPSTFGGMFTQTMSDQLKGLKNQSGALYDELRQATNQKVPLDGLKTKINQAISSISDNGQIPESISKDLGSAASAIKEIQGMPEASVEMLRSLRRSIGNASKDSPFGNVLGQISKDITDELGGFYNKLGPDLGQKYQQAESLYAAYKNQQNVLRQSLGKQTADNIARGETDAISSEAIANQLSGLASRQTGGQNLSALMGILPEKTQSDLGNYLINQAAQKSSSPAAVGEIFDPTKFNKNISPFLGAKETGLTGQAGQASMQKLADEASLLAPGADVLKRNIDSTMLRENANPFMFGAGGAGLGALMGLDPITGGLIGAAAPFAMRGFASQLAKRPGLVANVAELTPARVATATGTLQEALNNPTGVNSPTPQAKEPTQPSNEQQTPPNLDNFLGTAAVGQQAPQKPQIPNLDDFLSGKLAGNQQNQKPKLPSIDEFTKIPGKGQAAKPDITPLSPDEVDSLMNIKPLSFEEIDTIVKPESIIPSRYAAAHKVLSDLESKGNYQAVNPSTKALGRYQFMAPTLEDVGFLNKGASKGRSTAATLADPSAWKIEGGKDAFVNSPELQDLAMRELMTKNENSLQKAGLINEDTDPRIVNGLLTLSHLYGVGGAKRFWNDGDFSYGPGNPMASSYFQKGFLAT